MTAFIRRYFAGGASATTLASSMSNSDTSFVINSSSGWPGTPGNPFYVVIDRGNTSEEKILCASNSGTTVTVTARGQDGTSATTHAANAPVEVCITGVDGDEANQAVNLLGNAAAGSIFYGGGAATLPSKLAIGAAGSILNSSGTAPQWLGIGSAGQFLGVAAGLPSWAGVLKHVAHAATFTMGASEFSLISGGITGTTPPHLADMLIGAKASDSNTANQLSASSGVFRGPGLGASGSSTLTLGSIGAEALLFDDGTDYHVVAGNADSGWIAPTLQGTWGASGSPYDQVGYRLIGSVVEMRGYLTTNGGNGATIFTLPAGYRPTATKGFGVATLASASAGIVEIASTGVVTGLSAGSSPFGFLDPVSFTVD